MTRYRFLFILFFPVILMSQNSKSFIIQVKKEVSNFQSEKNFSRSSNLRKLKQICAEPLNIWTIEVKDEITTSKDLYRLLEADNDVISIKENRKITERAKPNDTQYNSQWQYNNTGTNSNGGKVGADINIESAWDITTGGVTFTGDTIVVAVVDDGLNINHEDISPNLWVNRNEIPGDSLDNDGNGFIDDIHGWNFGENNNDILSDGSHGTSVAGIIGAKGNNGVGVTGVNWNVKLMPINYGNATEANAIASYAYAYKMRKMYNESNGTLGAFVVATNSSWGIDYADPNESPLWCAFYDSLGVIGILSAGATANQNVNVDIDGDLPTGCESEYLISVTNLNSQDNKVSGAGYGLKSVDIGAYGQSTFTVSSNGGYTSFGGTSGATPHVAGTIALLYSVDCALFNSYYKSNPAQTALSIKDIILNNTTPNTSLETITSTGGKLNVTESVLALQKQCSSCATATAISVKSISENSVSIFWKAFNAYTKIRYRKIDAQVWINTNFSNNDTIILNNLDFCTEYQFQVSSNCSELFDDWGYLKYFTTTGCCIAPQFSVSMDSNIHVLNLDSDNIIIEYKNQNNLDWIANNIDENIDISLDENCSQYQIRAKRYCALQDSFSIYSDEINLSTNCEACGGTDYCFPDNLSNNQEWIESVTFNGVENFSSKNDNAYGNYIGKVIPEIAKSDTLFLGLKQGYAGTSYFEFFRVYIDWNHNQIFDENEIAYETPSATKQAIDTFIVAPENPELGLTRMRIVMTYRFGAFACDNEDIDFGEIEDYCLMVRDTIINENKYLSLINSDKLWYTIENIDTISNNIYRINTDSFVTINDEIFYQIETSNNGIDWTGNDYLYQNNNIVKYYNSDYIYNLFDFDLAVGDSIPFWFLPNIYYYVNKVDTLILSDGVPRKQIHLQDSKVKWIEGIGNFRQPFLYHDWALMDEFSYLSCYFENGNLVYENTEDEFDECFFVTNNDELINPITIFPNPTSEKINVITENDGLFYLYDLKGTLIEKSYLTKGKNEKDISILINGAYLARIIQNNGIYKNELIIKN